MSPRSRHSCYLSTQPIVFPDDFDISDSFFLYVLLSPLSLPRLSHIVLLIGLRNGCYTPS